MVVEYKTTVTYMHSPNPWDNELMQKNRPISFIGWFTIDELRKKNRAFENKDADWTPNLDLPYADEVSLLHPHSNYSVLISESRIRGM